EYHRRVTAERTRDAKRRAVARGVPPFPNIPPGYRRDQDGGIEVDPKTASAVAEGFRLRAAGATVKEVREHLRRAGVERSYHGVQAMLSSRIYLGELRFGEYVRDDPRVALVESAVWQAVQRMRSPRGRRAKSERLLARLGVLRCGTCGARMVIGSTDQKGTRHYFYRCPPVGDCPRRVTVSADLAERIVVEEVRRLLEGVRGRASIAGGVEEAEQDLDRRERELDAAIRAFSGLEDVDAARERLLALRQ